MPPHESGSWFVVASAATLVGLFVLLGPGGLVVVVSAVISALFMGYLVRHVVFATSAGQWVHSDLRGVVDLSHRPSVSVIAACKNEELVVDALVDRLAALDYPRDRLQIIIVDDHSDDATGELLDARAAQDARLAVLHRSAGRGGGKSGALNDAADLACGEVLVIFDADHEPTADSVARLVRHFEDPQTGAVMGRCVIKNRDDSLISQIVWLEYLAGYLCDEYGRQAVFGLPAYGGANCAVRASALRQVGGYNERSVTEDTDLTVRLILSGYRVRFDVTAVDYEQAVPSLKRYRTQRYRWAWGHQQVWRDYWRAVMRSPVLSPVEKVETMMFLWLYHVPVAQFLSFTLIPILMLGVGATLPAWILVLFPLFLLGPFLQIATGLINTKDARPRHVWLMLLLIPVMIVYVFTCARCWFDALRGASYRWVKTTRTAS